VQILGQGVRLSCSCVLFPTVPFRHRGQAGHGVGPVKKTKTNLFRLNIETKIVLGATLLEEANIHFILFPLLHAWAH
jgi:hypothetical protein